MNYLVFIAALFLTGCSQLLDTSLYDDNESMLAVDVRYAVETLNCDYPTQRVKFKVLKFKLYSESKKSKDVQSMVSKMYKTAETLDMNTKPAVCKIKKKILQKQSKDIANAIMRRY